MRYPNLARLGCQSRCVKHHQAWFVGGGAAVLLALAAGSWASLGAESSPLPPATSSLQETNAQGLAHPYWQLEEQLRATQLAIEQNRQETKAAAAQNAEALSKGLLTFQQAFLAQRAQDLAAMQSTNKVILIVVGTFAAMSFLTMLIMTYFQWRMSKGLAEISVALPAALGLGTGSAAGALALANQPELRLFGAMEASEDHPRELEPGSHPALGRREGTRLAIENRLFHEPGALVRRRRFRAVSMAVMVGLICAAGLALLLYVVAYRKLGFG